jgi:hypothetical protein
MSLIARRNELVHRIAAELDKPSVYMGGPSKVSRRRAEKIVDLLPDYLDQGAVSLDDPVLIETLARVIENRHGTLHGIGSTLREALDELKRGRSE